MDVSDALALVLTTYNDSSDDSLGESKDELLSPEVEEELEFDLDDDFNNNSGNDGSDDIFEIDAENSSAEGIGDAEQSSEDEDDGQGPSSGCQRGLG